MILKNVVTKFLYILLIGGWIFLSIFSFLGLNLIANSNNYNIPAESDNYYLIAESSNQPIVSGKNGNNLVYISYDIFKDRYSFDPITSNISGNNINSASLILKNQYQRPFSIIHHKSSILNVIDSKISNNQIRIIKLIFALLRSLEKMQLYFILHETKDDVLNNLLIDFMNVKTEYDSMNYTFCFFIQKYIPKINAIFDDKNLMTQFFQTFTKVIKIITKNYSLKNEVKNDNNDLKECNKHFKDFKHLFSHEIINKFEISRSFTSFGNSIKVNIFDNKLIFLDINNSESNQFRYFQLENIVKYSFYITFHLKDDIVQFLKSFLFANQVKHNIKLYNHYYKIIGFINFKSEEEIIRLNLFDGNNLQIYEDYIWRNIPIHEIYNYIKELDAFELFVILEIIKN